MKFFIYFISGLLLLSCTKNEPLVCESTTNTESITLMPSIGLTSKPDSSDVICTIPPYTSNNYDTNGIQVGEIVNDFTLYNISEQAFNLKQIINNNKKPIFLISGSYTCPVFRNKIKQLNRLIRDYGNQIDFYQIYVVEPHPDVDVSPYSGNVWTTNQNNSAGILYRQPTSYGERLDIIKEMTDSMTINCEILIDGPCNEYWLSYGEAPNRAYLIDETGKVVVMHGWFDYPSMVTSINTFLGM